jgi:5'-nucleotidase
LPQGVLLNVNVPNLPQDQIQSYRLTKQGKRIYGDALIEKVDPRGEKYFWIGGQELGFEPIVGSDLQAVEDGSVSITPIHMDMTEYKVLVELSGMTI